MKFRPTRVVLILLVLALVFGVGFQLGSRSERHSLSPAERMIGLDYTAAQQDSLQDNL